MYYYWKQTYNRATLIGIVVDELKKWPSTRNIATFSISTELFWKGSDGEEKSTREVHPIIVWDYLADIAKNIIKKGALVLVEGCFKSRSYSVDGVQKQITEIMAERIVVLSYKPTNDKKSKMVEQKIEKSDDDKSKKLETHKQNIDEKADDEKSEESKIPEQDIKNIKKIMSLLDDELF